MQFELDPQLAADCEQIGDLPLCRLLLAKDSNYPWFILVPRRAGIHEIFQLTVAEQQQLLQESSALSSELQRVFAADKLNIAALGNVVSQLHIHHIVRYQQDPAWPAPIWGKIPAQNYSKSERAAIQQKINALNLAELNHSLILTAAEEVTARQI